MDERLIAVSDNLREITRNLLVLQGEVDTTTKHEAIEDALADINTFETKRMKAVQVVVEGG